MKQVTAYQTSDGQLFLDKGEADTHEFKTAAAKSAIAQLGQWGFELTPEQQEMLGETLAGSGVGNEQTAPVAAPVAQESTPVMPVSGYSPAGAAPAISNNPPVATPAITAPVATPAPVAAAPVATPAPTATAPMATTEQPVQHTAPTVPQVAIPATPQTAPKAGVTAPSSMVPAAQVQQQPKPTTPDPTAFVTSNTAAPANSSPVVGAVPPPTVDMKINAPPTAEEATSQIVDTSVANSIANPG